MNGDIVSILQEEARFGDIAENVGDEHTAEYSRMCLAAASEITALRDQNEKLRDGIRSAIVALKVLDHPPNFGALAKCQRLLEGSE